jgi:hypothetical protein
MTGTSPFRSSVSDGDKKEADSGSSKVHLKGVEAFKKVTNSLAAQQKMALAHQAASKNAGHSIEHKHPTKLKKPEDQSSDSAVSMRKRGRQNFNEVPFQVQDEQEMPEGFLAAASSSAELSAASGQKIAVSQSGTDAPFADWIEGRAGSLAHPGMGRTVPSSIADSVPEKRRESVADLASATIKRKRAKAVTSGMFATFTASDTDTTTSAPAKTFTASKSATASQPVDNSIGVEPVASADFAGKTINMAKSGSGKTVGGEQYWEVPVEGLGAGVAHLLGDAVGGVVNAGKAIGGIGRKKGKTVRKKSRKNASNNASNNASRLRSITVRGGVKNIFSGAGLIVKGGAGIVVGSLGCLGGALVCMSGAGSVRVEKR